MDKEKLEKANFLNYKIEETKLNIKKVNRLFKDGAENKGKCFLWIMEEEIKVDYSVFKEALLMQKNIEKSTLERLEKEFFEI